MPPSSTVEDYLKAIYLKTIGVGRGDRLLPMGQLATAVGVTPGSATTMVKTLADSGLVRYEPYAGVGMTPAGEQLAARVVRRHRLIELFLVRVLRFGWDEVHEEAELLEHAVSDALIERIDEMLGRPAVDPHGDPIPSSSGEIRPQDVESLLSCPLGSEVTIKRVLDQDKAFLRFVERHNLTPGQTIRVQARDEAADSVQISGPSGQPITVGTRAASKVLVETAAQGAST